MHKEKAQGGLELLLLIGGAVLVAGTVLVFLLGNSSTGVSQTQKNYCLLEEKKQEARIKYSLPCGVNEGGLAGYWKFENDLSDTSRNGNTGSAVGTITYTPGKSGMAGSFNGASYVSVPNSPSLTFGNAMSISVWTRQNPTIDADTQRSLAGRNVSYLHISYGQSRYTVYAAVDPGGCNPGYCQAMGGTILPADTWLHIVSTFDGANIRIYENGVLKQTMPWATNITSSSATFYIGGGLWGGSVGDIDEVIVFSRTLTESEVKSIYNAGS